MYDIVGYYVFIDIHIKSYLKNSHKKLCARFAGLFNSEKDIS